MTDEAPQKFKPTDRQHEGGEEKNTRLEKAPDANAVRNASGSDRQTALDAFTDKYRSVTDLRSIPEGATLEQLTAQSEGRPEPFTIVHDDGEEETVKGKHKKPDETKNLEQISKSDMMMAIAAERDPAMEPVALTRQYADSLPDDDPRKIELTKLTRQQATELSPELRAHYEANTQKPDEQEAFSEADNGDQSNLFDRSIAGFKSFL